MALSARSTRSRRPRDPWRLAEMVVTILVLGVVVGFTLSRLHPRLLLTATTPAGGDMGAHVWGPAYLRDELLPAGRLTGWSPDWYAGFPAYRSYFLLPALAIVGLDLVLPYGVAFKLVTVAGLLTLPVAAWALGRLARLPFPGPPLLAVATLPFLFDRSFTIYGGNVASTMAGEFSFSISLSIALVFLGVVLRGLETGRSRALAAALLAACALCHVIPATFAVVGALVALALRPGPGRLRWVAPAGLVGGLLTAFWTVPFLLRSPVMNDMGYEKLTTYWEHLLPGRLGDGLTRLAGGEGAAQVNGDLTWVALLAVAGVVTSVAFRRRLGVFLAVTGALFALGFVTEPVGQLWNARLLPFWYLTLYLLAGVAVAELAGAVAALVAGQADSRRRPVVLAAPVLGVLGALLVVGVPLRALPGGETAADGKYRWGPFVGSVGDRNVVSDWARWNYSGYEAKEAWPEYSGVVDTMARVGRERGCGRALWEYEHEKLDRYGTPMALMLLPYWTDGCIGSLEGLFFESSSTTPFHFLTAAELSAAPSNPQRGLPYGRLDVGKGVEHLRMLGVRYYMAFSPQAVAQADAEEGLTPVASSADWRVYEVAGSELVSPLAAEPVVLEGAPTGDRWLEPAVAWFDDPAAWEVPLVASGPSTWARAAPGARPAPRLLPPTSVGDVSSGPAHVRFTVDRPGTPVLVRTSWDPNWSVEGAEGPYRVAPNLMVVVPTSTAVELRYGSTPVEWLGRALTVAGLVGVVVLARLGPVRFPSPGRRPEDVLGGPGLDPAERRPAGAAGPFPLGAPPRPGAGRRAVGVSGG